MKRDLSTSISQSRYGDFPNCLQRAGTNEYHKGWSSERLPLAVYSRRSRGGSGALVPFSNGKALPWKWEDAERWILSPVSGDGIGRHSIPSAHIQRPKSKSGPLGPSAATIGGSYSTNSPLVPCFDGGTVGNFSAHSPFLMGVLMPEAGCRGSGIGGRECLNSGGSSGGRGSGKRESFTSDRDTCIVRSTSIHGWAEALIESSSPSPSCQDDKFEGSTEESLIVSRSPGALKKDAATQMSPEGSATSSRRERPSVASPSAQPIQELESQFAKFEVSNAQADDRVAVMRWSKKHRARSHDKCSTKRIELEKTTVEADSYIWEPTETARAISKYKRDEAKIRAWENLQKAKAEAEIRKLEVKLEKKRVYTIEKILNKLKVAQKKAQEMRTAVNGRKSSQTTKKLSYFTTGQISSLSGCFTCHAL